MDKARGTILEIEAGRIDIGASIQVLFLLPADTARNALLVKQTDNRTWWLQFLSQYPSEAEFLMQPLSCLEVPLLRARRPEEANNELAPKSWSMHHGLIRKC